MRIIKYSIKLLLAGLLAICFLSIVSFFYYNYGIRKTSLTGASDYSWENCFYSQMYEGFGMGWRDKDGYNNAYGAMNSDNIDILLMGSSQMEANNVWYTQNAGYLLNKMFDESDSNMNLYNIGTEGHNFGIQVDNLDDALSTYNPSKYVILEMFGDVEFNEVRDIIENGRTRTPAYDEGVVYYAQKIPYFRILNRQYQNMLALLNNESDGNTAVNDNEIDGNTTEDIEMVLDCIVKMCDEYGCIPIILYLPNGIDEYDPLDKQIYMMCSEKGILVVDMSYAFQTLSDNTWYYPYGFWNTTYGSGHLNRKGHELIASSLYEKIIENEE